MEIDPLELLALWWKFEREWNPVEGYPVECPSTRGWRASRQHDDINGAQETDARGMLIRHISQIVSGIEEPYRTALYMVARNHATGAAVWRSARLPENEQDRMEVVSVAVRIFTERI